MLYFRDFHWLFKTGASRFSAYIAPEARGRKDVHWALVLNYVAGGPKWRRVNHWERPAFDIQASGFDPKSSHWTGLEQMNVWSLEEEDESDFSTGSVEASFYPKGGAQGRDQAVANYFIWRVAGREASLFTVEMAGFMDAESLRGKMEAREMEVTPEGREISGEPDAEFWKMNSSVYLVEQVPFGTVTVRVPRNAKDAEAFALARARALIGVEEPEDVEITDYSKYEKSTESLRDDIYVELHFNGYFED